jgi:hypothetical protein
VVFGTITASDASSLTLQTANGGTRTIPLNTSTKIVVTRDGTAADLTVGENVLVFATRGNDGGLTVSRIQVGIDLPQERTQSVRQGRGRWAPPSGNGRFGG